DSIQQRELSVDSIPTRISWFDDHYFSELLNQLTIFRLETDQILRENFRFAEWENFHSLFQGFSHFLIVQFRHFFHFH
ncbi:hypothetical protein PFISCL1PPCAC_16903, partial [Pristionchus fissidentatus]